MLSEAKHLAFSSCCKDEILRLEFTLSPSKGLRMT
jgi:hypothetical protein